jgi:putative NADPH-quinone reductase
MARLVIVQGHPDPAGGHLCHALADAYAHGAGQAGHTVMRIDVASLDFPWLQTKAAFEAGPIPDALRPAQEAIGQADHLCIVYPLWHGTFPAVLKAFLEQVFRPGFAYDLGFCGIRPIRESLFGMIETATAAQRAGWLDTMRRLGARAR